MADCSEVKKSESDLYNITLYQGNPGVAKRKTDCLQYMSQKKYMYGIQGAQYLRLQTLYTIYVCLEYIIHNI